MDDVEPTETECQQNRLHLAGNTATIREAKSHSLDGVKVVVSNKVTCLGVTAAELTFAAHIKCLAGWCFYQLRQLGPPFIIS